MRSERHKPVETFLFKKRAIFYVSILYSFLLIGWLVTFLVPGTYTVLWGFFSVLPIGATILTRIITKDKSPWYLKPNLRKNWKTYLFAAFLPGVTIFLGGLLYFLLFPQDLDLSARNLVAQYGQYGAPQSLLFTTQTGYPDRPCIHHHLPLAFACTYICPRRGNRLARLPATQTA